MIEKIKKNKLRTVCIGLSAFLFGFITVTLFNSMSNTYAVEYSCKSGWKLVDSQEGICCPEESGLFSGKTKCYIYITDVMKVHTLMSVKKNMETCI